jgi:hypothetical protein
MKKAAPAARQKLQHFYICCSSGRNRRGEFSRPVRMIAASTSVVGIKITGSSFFITAALN